MSCRGLGAEVGVMPLSSDIEGLRKANALRALEGRVPLAASFCQPLWSFQA